MPVVSVFDGTPPDVEVDAAIRASSNGQAIEEAVRRAIRLVEYETAVGQLYDACRWNVGRRTRDLEPIRERADECFRALDACSSRLPFERLVDA